MLLNYVGKIYLSFLKNKPKEKKETKKVNKRVNRNFLSLIYYNLFLPGTGIMNSYSISLQYPVPLFWSIIIARCIFIISIHWSKSHICPILAEFWTILWGLSSKFLSGDLLTSIRSSKKRFKIFVSTSSFFGTWWNCGILSVSKSFWRLRNMMVDEAQSRRRIKRSFRNKVISFQIGKLWLLLLWLLICEKKIL